MDEFTPEEDLKLLLETDDDLPPLRVPRSITDAELKKADDEWETMCLNNRSVDGQPWKYFCTQFMIDTFGDNALCMNGYASAVGHYFSGDTAFALAQLKPENRCCFCHSFVCFNHRIRCITCWQPVCVRCFIRNTEHSNRCPKCPWKAKRFFCDACVKGARVLGKHTGDSLEWTLTSLCGAYAYASKHAGKHGSQQYKCPDCHNDHLVATHRCETCGMNRCEADEPEQIAPWYEPYCSRACKQTALKRAAIVAFSCSLGIFRP